MKQKFREIKFHKKNLILLEKIREILQEYQEQGIKVTLRQLYYQLVSRDIIPNQVKEYSKLSGLLTDARYNGNIDWDAIEDRVRIPNIPSTFKDVNHLIKIARDSYQLDRWKNQKYHVEIWTEKDAISSVIQPLTNEYQVTLCVNRGYSSASAMFESARRLRSKVVKECEEWNGRTCIILYLGDYDPSGLDMVRDIRERISEFTEMSDFKIIPIALTREQINQYKPPPNPAKIKDPRAKWFIENYGNTSWEVDALRPEVLQKLIEKSILEYLDLEKFELVKKKELDDKKSIKITCKEVKE
jgi:hypothetical protein